MSQNYPNILLIDAIPFQGGSKVATRTLLHELTTEHQLCIFTQTPQSWQGLNARFYPLYMPRWLINKDQGIIYFIKYLLIALQVLLRKPSLGKITLAVGASGPSVDLALYMLKPLLGFTLMQLVHGGVACSKTNARCLLRADSIHYLPSSRASMVAALARYGITDMMFNEPRFTPMLNGLDKSEWPSEALMHSSEPARPVIFWAASLLKWKGLSILNQALQELNASDANFSEQGFSANICYIQPKNIALEYDEPEDDSANIHWFNQPSNLDEMRRQSSIYVSTSQQEPFGLSTLEAMAAGLCVVIPSDASYWDLALIDGANCIKYRPGDSQDLRQKLEHLIKHPQLMISLGRHAMFISRNYHAEQVYLPQLQVIDSYLGAGSSKAQASITGVF
ncbi:glycosyltransferase family 4 protein [Shewanella sp. SNU WT4]|uniref:glycosyltransferase family 4 protein n=1 Tax=Shewanella sp. SNU WT4 TaxID=2590015 RepID=UPI00112A652D|nr:glycosyltransferase family 4 protein [Shewanella sp. SNU WT4]QDF68138.1 glycosyltransferase family 4 protein [Shewanella sp. SNU WT4]